MAILPAMPVAALYRLELPGRVGHVVLAGIDFFDGIGSSSDPGQVRQAVRSGAVVTDPGDHAAVLAAIVAEDQEHREAQEARKRDGRKASALYSRGRDPQPPRED